VQSRSVQSAQQGSRPGHPALLPCHSGGEDLETADAKNAALRAAGAIVPSSFEDMEDTVRYAAGLVLLLLVLLRCCMLCSAVLLDAALCCATCPTASTTWRALSGPLDATVLLEHLLTAQLTATGFSHPA
jgi:hypothetical protein